MVRIFALLIVIVIHVFRIHVNCTFRPSFTCDIETGTNEIQLPSCSMNDEVTVNGEMSVIGTNPVRSEIWAKSNKRHFTIENEGSILRLEWLILSNGRLPLAFDGGSIIVNVDGSYIVYSYIFILSI